MFVVEENLRGNRMQTRTIVIVLLAGTLAGPSGRASGGKDGTTDRVAALVKQLGHPRFAAREEAVRALVAIGEPAVGALKKALADRDAEVRIRAQRILDGIASRALATAANKELARWQGDWEGNGKQKLVIQDDRWAWGEGGPWKLDDTHRNLIDIVAVGDKVIEADLIVMDPAGPRVCRAIFRLDGDTLHYCGTYDAVRPTEFKTSWNAVHVAWKRLTK